MIAFEKAFDDNINEYDDYDYDYSFCCCNHICDGGMEKTELDSNTAESGFF